MNPGGLRVPLGELMLERGGSTDPSKHPDKSFILYSIPAYDVGRPETLHGSEIGSAKKNVQAGDVLLSRIVPHIRRSWIVGEHANNNIIASGEWIVFRDERFDPSYLRHFFLSDPFHVQFMQTVAGVGGSLLRARPDHVGRIDVHLPPLEEQKRIAGILDKADALRAKRRQAIALLNSLTQSIFLEMFGDLRANPHNYPVVAVGDVTDCIVPGRDKPKSFTGTIPWITTGELNALGYTLSMNAKQRLSEIEIGEVRAKIIPKDSVILTCVGDLGMTSIAGEPIVINQQLHSFQCSHRVTAEYLMYALTFAKEYMLSRATKTTLPYMNKSVCNSIPIPLPPIEYQKHFSLLFSAIKARTQTITSASSRIDSLFASLQHRAFTGQL